MKLSSLVKNYKKCMAILLFTLVFGFAMPTIAVYADGDTDSGENNTNPDQPETPGGDTETPNPGDGSGDYNEDPDRNDPPQGGGNDSNLPGHITNPGTGNNNSNNNSAATKPDNSSTTNNRPSSSNNTSRGNQNNTSNANTDSSDKKLSEEDQRHKDDEKEDTSVTSDDNDEVIMESHRSEKESKTSQDFGGLAWIFAAVIGGIVVLVGTIAFFVDRFSKKGDNKHEDLLESVLDTNFKSEVEAIKKQDTLESEIKPKSKAKSTSTKTNSKLSASSKSPSTKSKSTKTSK